jgi:hypothetical protein
MVEFVIPSNFQIAKIRTYGGDSRRSLFGEMHERSTPANGFKSDRSGACVEIGKTGACHAHP